MTVNRERIALWADALESGEYEQGVGKLHIPASGDVADQYCCLGVACKVAFANGVEPFDLDELTSLPAKIASWYGLDEYSANPNVGRMYVVDENDGPESVLVDAVEANDMEHWDFKRIAGGIRDLYLNPEVDPA